MQPSSADSAPLQHPPDADTQPGDEAKLFAAQLQLAFERLPMSALMTIGVVVIFVGLLAPFFTLLMSIVWAATMTVIASGRYLLWRAYAKKRPVGDALRTWDRLFTIGALLAGMGWAIGPVAMMP